MAVNKERYEKLLDFLQLEQRVFWKDYGSYTLEEITDFFCLVKNKRARWIIRNLIKTKIKQVSPNGELLWKHSDKGTIESFIKSKDKPTKEELINLLGNELLTLLELTSNSRWFIGVIPPLFIEVWEETWKEKFPATSEEITERFDPILLGS